MNKPGPASSRPEDAGPLPPPHARAQESHNPFRAVNPLTPIRVRYTPGGKKNWFPPLPWGGRMAAAPLVRGVIDAVGPNADVPLDTVRPYLFNWTVEMYSCSESDGRSGFAA